MDRRLPQKMFATGDERCPVKLLEKLISLQPPSLKHSGSLQLRNQRVCVHTCPTLPLTVHWESGTSLFPVTKGLATVPPVHPFIGP